MLKVKVYLFLCFYLQSTILRRHIVECSYSFTHR